MKNFSRSSSRNANLAVLPSFRSSSTCSPHGTHPWLCKGSASATSLAGGQSSNFDLAVYVSDQGESIQLRFVYNADLFSQARMAEMLRQYRQLLEQVLSAPEKPINTLSLVTSEAHPLLPDPRALLAEPPQETVMQMFAAWADRAPDSPAVIQAGRNWTYGTLSECAHSLARHLLARGLQPGDVVAVFGSRSFGLIASMIGTFMSGCVLLPIDPSLPLQRQQLMLREAAAKAMLRVSGAYEAGGWSGWRARSGCSTGRPRDRPVHGCRAG